MNIEELAAKRGEAYPGYKLVDFYEAALPSYSLVLQALMHRQRPLTAIEEFILRSVDTGQETVDEVAGLLGLEWAVVEMGLDTLQRRSCVSLKAPLNDHREDVRIELTNHGRSALSELILYEPEPTSFNVCLDALTGQFYPSRPLMQPKDVRELGLHEIPTLLAVPRLEELDRMALKRIVRESQRDLPDRSERRELSEILAVEKTWTAYRTMRVLQYIRAEDGALQVEVYDGSERSRSHESALLQMETSRYRPLRAVSAADVPPADPAELDVIDRLTLAAARRSAVEAPKLEVEIKEKREAIAEAEARLGSRVVSERQDASHRIEQLQQELAERENRLHQLEQERGSVEVLQMHEHRPKLMAALKEATHQLIIVSPWLNGQAVDYELRQEIGNALKRGVLIQIGYGFGEPNPEEKRTIEKLRRVAQNKRGRLKLYRVGEVHSKVLICDDRFMVMGSFNWLSFGGDPTRGSRVEDGMLTRDKKAIAQKTQEWLGRFAQSAAGTQ
jgi:hypothetical protein